jgi:hypothetical protein
VSTRWVIAPLVVLAVWMAFMLYVFRPLPDRLFLGGSFLTIGIMNVPFCKTNGRKLFVKTQASPPFVARVWASAGEKGVQVPFLAIGIIFAVAGWVVIVLGPA